VRDIEDGMDAREFMEWAAELRLRAKDQEDRDRGARLASDAERVLRMGR